MALPGLVLALPPAGLVLVLAPGGLLALARVAIVLVPATATLASEASSDKVGSAAGIDWERTGAGESAPTECCWLEYLRGVGLLDPLRMLEYWFVLTRRRAIAPPD